MRKYFLIFLLFFSSSVFASLDVNVSVDSLNAGEINLFNYSLSCSGETEHLSNGDLVDYIFSVCFNSSCSIVEENSFVFKSPCSASGVLDIFVPDVANSEVVESVEIVFFAKRFEEVDFPLRQTFTFGGAFISDSALSFPIVPLEEQPDLSFWLLVVGIIFIVLSIILVYLKQWYALFPFLLGVVLVVLGIFGV